MTGLLQAALSAWGQALLPFLLSCVLAASCTPGAGNGDVEPEAERHVRRDAGAQSAAEPAAHKPTGDVPAAAAHVRVGLLQQARADAHRRVTMQVRCKTQHTAGACMTAVQLVQCQSPRVACHCRPLHAASISEDAEGRVQPPLLS